MKRCSTTAFTMERGSTMSRERTVKRGHKSTRGAASVRSSRNQASRNTRTTNSSNGQEAVAAAASTRVVIDGVDVTPRSLLFPDENPAPISKDVGSNTTSNSTSSRVRSSTRKNQRMSSDSNEGRFSTQTNSRSRGKENQDIKEEGPMDYLSNMDMNPVLLGKKGETRGKQPTSKKNQPNTTDSSTTGQQVSEQKKPKLTAKELSAMVELQLNETRTETLIHIIGSCIGLDSTDHKLITERNKAYDLALETREAQLDRFLDHQAQTFNLGLKEKQVNAKPVETQETSCQAASWDIWDAQVEQENMLAGALNKLSKLGDEFHDTQDASDQGVGLVNKRVEQMVALSLATPGCLLPLENVEAGPKSTQGKRKVQSDSVGETGEDQASKNNGDDNAETEIDGQQVLAKREAESIMNSQSLLDSLRAVERSIQQNNYHSKHLRYRAVNLYSEEQEAESETAGDDDNKETEVSGEAEHVAIDGVDDEVATQAATGDDPAAVGETSAETAGSVAGSESVVGEVKEGENEVGENDDLESISSNRGKTSRSQSRARVTSTRGRFSTRNSMGSMLGTGLDGDIAEMEVKFTPPSLERLWQFKCPESSGRNVSAMAWNSANPDLLAVAYGQFDFSQQRDGAILFWTLKNPEFPERIIPTSSGVCSLEFSKAHPSMLAVGMYNGNVAIYDLRPDQQSDGDREESTDGKNGGKDKKKNPNKNGNEGEKRHKPGNNGAKAPLRPMLESSNAAGSKGHTDAVWQVRWVDRRDGMHGRSQEVLVSISMDGRITEWSLKKGLTATDLMVLKRVNSPYKRGLGAGDGIISRTAAGLCFDTPSDNPSIYYAATEDGTIHKCSCSYNEQYLETYFGHAGPVNKIHCSPFAPNVFITCSADWTMRLWDADKTEAVSTLQAVDLSDVVHDVCWSPASSTVFGSVTGDGRVEIWDLAQNTLDPVITKFIGASRSAPENSKKLHYSSIAFARNAPVVVVGDSHGTIDVFRLSGSGFGIASDDDRASPDFVEEEAVRLHEAMYPESFVANE